LDYWPLRSGQIAHLLQRLALGHFMNATPGRLREKRLVRVLRLALKVKPKQSLF
jgi:hypothetical protein